MFISELRSIAPLANLPVISADDPQAESLLDPNRFLEIAEVVDTVRLFELLHRDQYRPLAIVRFGSESDGEVRAYFCHCEADAERGSSRLPRKPR